MANFSCLLPLPSQKLIPTSNNGEREREIERESERETRRETGRDREKEGETEKIRIRKLALDL